MKKSLIKCLLVLSIFFSGCRMLQEIDWSSIDWGLKPEPEVPEQPPEPPEEILSQFPIGDNRFLWKPASDIDGNLAVIFPSRLPYKDIKDKWIFNANTKFINKAWIEYSGGSKPLSIRPTHISEPEDKKTNLLNPNGNRVHSRSSFSGSYFGKNINVKVEWLTKEGDSGIEIFFVPDGSQRTY